MASYFQSSSDCEHIFRVLYVVRKIIDWLRSRPLTQRDTTARTVLLLDMDDMAYPFWSMTDADCDRISVREIPSIPLRYCTAPPIPSIGIVDRGAHVECAMDCIEGALRGIEARLLKAREAERYIEKVEETIRTGSAKRFLPNPKSCIPPTPRSADGNASAHYRTLGIHDRMGEPS